ncbi:MAG: hypothetical protein AB1420_16690 [Bacillota bacterium]
MKSGLKDREAYTASVDFFRFSGKRDFAASLIDACLENRNRAMLALTPFFVEILDDLSARPQVRRVLHQLAKGENTYQEGIHPTTIKRAIDHLINRAVIEKAGRGSYVFTEPMFQQYILQQYR